MKGLIELKVFFQLYDEVQSKRNRLSIWNEGKKMLTPLRRVAICEMKMKEMMVLNTEQEAL